MAQRGLRNRKRIRLSPTIEDWAVIVLLESSEPMNYRVITEKIMERRTIGGTTPKKSVYAILLRSKRIKQLGNGIFDLVER